jgi:outer membrane protein
MSSGKNPRNAWRAVDERQPGIRFRSRKWRHTNELETNMKKNAAATVLAALGIALTGAAQADDVSSPWIVRLGMHDVDPKSNNHAVVNVGSAKSLTFNVTRMLDEHWGVELLAALPFEHDIYLNTGGKVADVKHLPPTLSAQYHFAPGAKIRPYVGAGLNATIFFSEHTTGALDGTKLSLGTSFGAAAQLGMDFDISDNWFLNADARWIDIGSRAKLDGTSLGSVAIDPLTIGVSIGRKF